MIKYDNNTINKMATNATVNKMYYGGNVVYLAVKGEEPPTPPTPSGNCYEVIQTPIASYTSTTDSVYSFADLKWYMKNNLNQYEEYGIYETGTSLSDFTYYPNKLAVIGETEYQYQENDWVEVGEYIDSQTTYEVTDDSMALKRKTLPTTFKIPYADVENIGRLNLFINTKDDCDLHITTDSYTYEYEDEEIYEGTVTNDEEYYYFSLPSEAPSSVVIQETDYSNLDPIHLIFGSRQISVEYAEKEMPLNQVYDTVAEMEATTCPNVGINEYGVVGNDVYQFEETEEWVEKAKSSLKFIAKYNDNNANVIECNTSNELSSGDTQPSYLSTDAMTEAYIGDCVTSIGSGAFDTCEALTSVTIPDSVTSIGDSAFCYCGKLTSVTIPDSVTSIGDGAFSNCSGLTSISIPSGVTSISDDAFFVCESLTSVTIPDSVTSIGNGAFAHCYNLTSVTIPSSVTSIGDYAFSYCTSLTSVTVNATTPPTLRIFSSRSYAFSNTSNNLVIYVPSASVDAYKSATNWSTYASRIQAIP